MIAPGPVIRMAWVTEDIAATETLLREQSAGCG